MSRTYRETELARAKSQVCDARSRFMGAKSANARQVAGEDLEFWTSKVAYLAAPLSQFEEEWKA